MAETYGAHYVSLHVRISNVAALKLYRDTLGFSVDKTEAKYYADGEDAFCMRMDLSDLRQQMDENDEEEGEAEDEGEAVGSAGAAEKKKPEAKRKVKVGRGLGV